MARSQITVTDVPRSGVAPITQTTSDATNKHYFTGATGREWIEVVSTDAGTQTVTVKISPTFTADGLTVSDLVISVAAGATKLFALPKVRTFSQNSTNDIYIDPSVSTNLKLRVYRLGTS